MRISDWSSDVCSSDLSTRRLPPRPFARSSARSTGSRSHRRAKRRPTAEADARLTRGRRHFPRRGACLSHGPCRASEPASAQDHVGDRALRSEEHTSQLQSLMRISYAVFCLKKKKQKHNEKIITDKTTTT